MPLAQKLVTYTGENITPCGTCEVTLTYDNQKYHLLFVVEEGLGPILLGRNWLEIIQLSWNSIHQLKAVNATPAVEVIMQGYLDIFTDELGELRNYTPPLRVDPNTKSIFSKARHVPDGRSPAEELMGRRLPTTLDASHPQKQQ